MAKPVIPALDRCKQEDEELAAILGYLLVMDSLYYVRPGLRRTKKREGGRRKVRDYLAVVVRGVA